MFDTPDRARPYRQGDVLLLPCSDIPASAHAMAADRVCYFRDDGAGAGGYVRAEGSAPVALTHEEHTPLMVPPGSYRVLRQREYQPRALPRAILD